MKFTATQYAQALYEAGAAAPAADHAKIIDRFVQVLAQNGDLQKYDKISAEYHRVELQAQGIREAQVTFARELEINKNVLEWLTKAVKGKAEFVQKVDNRIVGGIIIKIDDTLIDASVKGQLEKLNKTLKE